MRRAKARAAGALLAAACALALPRSASAVDDPELSYRTLETPHFVVHYDVRLIELAERVAALSEQAHQVLTPLLDWEPAAKTQVVVTDRTDSPNGSATTYLRNRMRIFGVPPGPDSALGYYEDWLRILVFHEYVHVLHLDTTLGIAPWLNTLVGKQFNPNQILPRWYIEGLATYFESARTGTGRVHSSLYKAWRDAELLSGRTLTLAQTSNGPVRWPFGSAPYLMGSFFVAWIADRHGEEFFARFHKLYGARIIPFSMNQAAREICGETFDQMWTLWIEEASAKARARLERARAAGLTPITYFNEDGVQDAAPRARALPNGGEEITYLHQDFRSHPYLGALRADGTEKLFEVDAAPGPGWWTPDGSRFLFSRERIERNVYNYQDLHVWDAETQQELRLTERERAREPAISPDGALIAYTRVRRGTMELVARRWLGDRLGEERVLVSGLTEPASSDAHWQQIADPVWAPDSRSIVFSWTRSDRGQRDLWEYRLDEPLEERLRPLMRDEAMDFDPHFGPDGSLYFASDREDGRYAIWRQRPGRDDFERVTRARFAHLSPWVSADNSTLYLIDYDETGYRLARAPLDYELGDGEVGRAPVKRPRFFDPLPLGLIEEERFYAPRRWLEPLALSGSAAYAGGAWGVSASVLSRDPLARHNYNASVSLAGADQWGDDIRPSFSADYTYAGWFADLSVGARHSDYIDVRGLVLNSARVPFRGAQTVGSIGAAYPLLSTKDNAFLQLRYFVDHRRYSDEPRLRLDPGSIEPVRPELGWYNGLRASFSYQWADRWPYSVSTERGFALGAGAEVRDPAIGADYKTLQLDTSASLFAPPPWTERQALVLRARAGAAWTNERRPRRFVLGGVAERNVFTGLVFDERASPGSLRGFPLGAAAGTRYATTTGEWRFPVWDAQFGLSTIPFYVRQLKGRLFTDAGTAYSGAPRDAVWRLSSGAELVAVLQLGYFLIGELTLGAARGWYGPEAPVSDFYFLYGAGF